MQGLAYWGKETFPTLTKIENNEIERINISAVDFINERIEDTVLMDIYKEIKSGNNTDLYSLLLTLGVLNFVYLLQTENGSFTGTWCRDIRVNYRDRYIFVPYYNYEESYEQMRPHKNVTPYLTYDADTKEVRIKYNYELKQYIIDDRTNDFRLKYITVLDTNKNAIYNIDIEGLMYLEVKNNSFNMNQLKERLLHASYIKKDYFEKELEKTGINLYMDNLSKATYIRLKESSKTKEGRLRKEYDLPTYKEDSYIPIEYREHRVYPFEKLFPDYNIFTTTPREDLEYSTPYWYRRYRYEMYLYGIFGMGLEPDTQEDKDKFNKLGVLTKHISYSYKGVVLILNYYYKDNYKATRRKTYDRYGLNYKNKVYGGYLE